LYDRSEIAHSNMKWVEDHFVDISVLLRDAVEKMDSSSKSNVVKEANGKNENIVENENEVEEQQADEDFDMNILVKRPLDPQMAQTAIISCTLDAAATIVGNVCKFESEKYSKVIVTTS